MLTKVNLFTCLTFFLVLFTASTLSSQESNNEELLQQSIDKLNSYKELIAQVKEEKENRIGYEARALGKQLIVNKTAYRNLLWQFVDDLGNSMGTHSPEKYTQLALAYLKVESNEIRSEIAQNDSSVARLENQIISAKKNIFTTNRAIGKDRLSDLTWKLYLKRKNQEELYFALVENSRKIVLLEKGNLADFVLGKKLVKKQADMLSGLIIINKEKLLKLKKRLSVVRNESETGKKLISEIALKNLEIQDYANRLQTMVDLLTSMQVNASLYKKTIIQTKNSLSSDILDKKVFRHLLSEWWISGKKWFTKKAPTLFGNTLTFLGIVLLAYLIAFFTKKIVRGIFLRTNPDISELAKNFIISISSKVIILIGLLIALSNLGIQIGPILAGLGIMGFIIGFALQETLSNFASGLMILFYRPFDVGDKIRVSGLEGKVRKMNLVSTTIFTSANHHLTVPNNKIWKDIIHNITSQPQVRMDLYFKAPFGSNSETVLSAISEEVENNPIVLSDKERNVRISELGEAEVKYIARFWILSDDIDEAKWVISEGVKRRFDEKGISRDIIESLKVKAV